MVERVDRHCLFKAIWEVITQLRSKIRKILFSYTPLKLWERGALHPLAQIAQLIEGNNLNCGSTRQKRWSHALAGTRMDSWKTLFRPLAVACISNLFTPCKDHLLLIYLFFRLTLRLSLNIFYEMKNANHQAVPAATWAEPMRWMVLYIQRSP